MKFQLKFLIILAVCIFKCSNWKINGGRNKDFWIYCIIKSHHCLGTTNYTKSTDFDIVRVAYNGAKQVRIQNSSLCLFNHNQQVALKNCTDNVFPVTKDQLWHDNMLNEAMDGRSFPIWGGEGNILKMLSSRACNISDCEWKLVNFNQAQETYINNLKIFPIQATAIIKGNKVLGTVKFIQNVSIVLN